MSVNFCEEFQRQAVLEKVCGMFAKFGGEIPSMFISDYIPDDAPNREEAALSVAIVPLPDDDAKDELAGFIKNMIVKGAVNNFCFVSEAWMSGNKNLSRPSEDPERKEIIVATFANSKGEYTYISEFIEVRGKKALSKFKRLPSGGQGRFVNLFESAKSRLN